jgi:hypothetical protein
VLFLGIATFIRLVEVQRESMVYITGMNRIRHFFHEAAPASRPYFVLPIYDDEPALYRSIGTGMRRNRPRFRLLHLTIQTQGIVGIYWHRSLADMRAATNSPNPDRPAQRAPFDESALTGRQLGKSPPVTKQLLPGLRCI